MTYLEAKEILRDAVAPRGERDLTARLVASPGRMSPMDTSTAGDLPTGESYADQILRALLVVRRHIAGQHLVEHDLLGILLFLDLPVRVLASESQHSETRIPQISLILHSICMSSMSANTPLEPAARRAPELFC